MNIDPCTFARSFGVGELQPHQIPILAAALNKCLGQTSEATRRNPEVRGLIEEFRLAREKAVDERRREHVAHYLKQAAKHLHLVAQCLENASEFLIINAQQTGIDEIERTPV
jgi:hypothetical protein